MAINLGDAILYFVGDTSGLVKSADESVKIAESAKNDMERMADDAASALQRQFEEATRKIGLAFAGIGGVITGFIGASVKAFDESERASKQLEAVLKSTGGAAGITADEIKRMASELQAQTGISDDATVSASAMLLTFTNIGKEIFPDVTKAVLDLATGLNKGATPSAEQLSQTAIMLGKAMQEPVIGVTALRRTGVQLSEQQEEQIKSFMAVNDIAGAQKIILGELAEQFGGRASAAAQTLGGQINHLREDFGDLMEVIGEQIAPAMSGLIDWLKSAIVSFREWAQEHPVLSQAVVVLTTAIGGFMLAASPILIFLPQVVASIQIMIGLLPSITAFFAGTGGIVVLVGAAVIALQQLASAWMAANQAANEAADVQSKLPATLRQVMDALDAAGVKYDAAKIATMETGDAIDYLNKLYYEQVVASQAAVDGVEANEKKKIELSADVKKKIEELEKSHADKVKEITDKSAADSQKNAEKLLDLAKTLADKQKDIAQNFGDAVRDIRDRFATTVAQMQREYRDRVRDFNTSIAEMQQEFYDSRQDAATDYYDALSDAEYEYMQRRAELMQSGDYAGVEKLDREYSDRLYRMEREYKQSEARAARDYQQAVERAQRKMAEEEAAFQERLQLEEERARELERIAAERQERETAKAIEEYNARVEENKKAEAAIAAEREKAFADLEAKYAEATQKLAEELGVSVDIVRGGAEDAANAHKQASDQSVAAWLEMIDWWESPEGLGHQNSAVEQAATTAERIAEANRISAEKTQGFWSRLWDSVKGIWERLTNFGDVTEPVAYASGGTVRSVPVIANEEGPEMATLPDGRRGIIGDGRPGIFALPVGTFINTASETAKMLFQSFASGGIIEQLSIAETVALQRMRKAFSDLVNYGRNTGQLTVEAWGILQTGIGNGWSEIVSTAKRISDGKFLRIQGVGGIGEGTWLSLEALTGENAGRIHYRDAGNDVMAKLYGLIGYARGGTVIDPASIYRGAPKEKEQSPFPDDSPQSIDDSMTGTVIQRFRDALVRAWAYLPYGTEELIEWLRRISTGWTGGLTRASYRDGRIAGYTGLQDGNILSMILDSNGVGNVAFGRRGALQRLSLPDIEAFSRGGTVLGRDSYASGTGANVVINIGGMTVREEADVEKVSRAIAGRVRAALAGGVY